MTDLPVPDDLVADVYAELRRVADGYVRRERAKSVHVRRVRIRGVQAIAIRRLLIERARRRHAAKRGGDQVMVTLDDTLLAAGPSPEALDLLALDVALSRLETLDHQQARIVELRFFGGLSVEETAEALSISPATVKRHWAVARAWLLRELKGAEPS